MQIRLILLFLSVAGSVLAGEIQWGDSTSLKSKEDRAYPTKDFTYKDLSPDSLSPNSHSANFDKAFETNSSSSFDKEYNLGNKEFKTSDVLFDKQYATKDLDLDSKVSPLGDHVSSLKIFDHPWSSRNAVGYDKELPNKEYTGRESKLVMRDMTEIYKKLNSVKDIPDRDITIDEVRDLVNKGHIPAAKAPAEKNQSPQVSPPSSLPDPTPQQH
jgi:hypothetical protein